MRIFRLLIGLFILLALSARVNAQIPTLNWAKHMGSNSSDEGLATTVDAAGNVYSTGYFIGTVDFDPGAGVTNLVANGSSDIFITKFGAAGNLLWAKSMGATPDEKGQGIAVDASGNVYVTGYFFNTVDFDPDAVGVSNLTSRGSRDAFVLKLDVSGNFVWAKRLGGTSTDEGRGIDLDTGGNVLTTGYFNGSGFFDPATSVVTISSAGLTDIFVSKLDASGNFVWAKRMGGTSFDQGNAIAVDALDNVLTTGLFDVTADFDPGIGSFPLSSFSNSNDIFVSKLDVLGNFAWAVQLGGIKDDLGTSIAVDAENNVITTGNFYFDFAGTPLDFDPGAGVANLTPVAGNNTSFPDIFIHKLNASGGFVWAKQLSGISNEEVWAVNVDAVGAVYTTGNFGSTVDFDPGASSFDLTSAGGYEIFISKLDASGNFAWAERIGLGSGKGIVVDASYNVITTGTFGFLSDFAPGSCVYELDTNGSDDIFIQKLSQTSLPGPTITNFAPTSGPAGIVVTITGTNFDPVAANNIVTFNGLATTVTASTSTSITTIVPVGATDGPISVSIVCSGATSASNFDVTGSCNIPAEERAALIDLYNSTSGDDWTNNTNWLTANESTWFGVTVSGCRVTELELPMNQLSGPLPPSISDLTFLEILKLDNNSITGTLPDNIGNMVALEEINLQANQMTGQIPASLEDCTVLENLHLEGNTMGGEIPSFIGYMTNIRSINLAFNHFEGEVPPELGYLSNLTFLSLADNWLYGEIPPELGQLSQLELLDLSRNEFYNPIPPELGDLTALVSLQLWDNSLNGSIPFELGSLSNLQELNLETNLLENSAPTSLQNLTQLKILSLANNEIDLVPDVIGGLPNLESVDISNNRLNTLPVFTSPSLTTLAVQNNRLHFGDLEPNSGVPTYTAHPQALLPPGGDIFFISGNTLSIPFTTPGTGNSYQWYKDGVAMLGANSATFNKPNASTSDIGLYTVRITSSIVLSTVLESVIYTALTDPCPAGPRETGEIDASFNPLVNVLTDMGALGLQSSGKILLSAPNTTINGTSHDGILRFNTDGSLDGSFQTISHTPMTNQMLVQPNDHIVTKTGSMYSGTVERFDANGNPDGVFNSNMPSFYNASLYSLGIQSDGRILIALNEDGTPRLVRLNTNGLYDGSFSASILHDATIIRVQSNDKILIDDTNSGGVIRLNADGSPDLSFSSTSSTGSITDIAIQPDGKILVTGSFDYFSGIPSRGFVRLNTDGSVDDTFSTIVIYDPDISSYQGKIGVMADGDIILGGYFSVVSGATRNSLVRLNSNGSVDCSLDPLLGPDNTINSLMLQSDGKILIAGQYVQYDGTVRNGFARVNNSSVTITIDFHPQNDTKCAGDLAFLTCVASGTTNMQYHWQFSTDGVAPYADISNGGGYTNVTSLTLRVTTTSGFGEGFYRCRISGDLAADKFSNPAKLDVITPPTPTANDITVCQGNSFTITASGGTDGNYRWADQEDFFSTQVNSVFMGDGATSYSLPFEVWTVEGTCQGVHVDVNVTFNPCTEPPVIEATEITVPVQGNTTLDLLPLLSDPDNDLDLASLTIVQQPSSGAVATINGTTLSIDYSGISFSGTDNLRISVCDLSGNCTEQELFIEVVGSVTAFNALSPGVDGKNDVFLLQNIDILESTKNNEVTIFNRWGDVVWEAKDYDNTTRVFKGLNKNGNELPSGVYFYRVTFGGGEKSLEGFISLKR